jgi:hypothetical protein
MCYDLCFNCFFHFGLVLLIPSWNHLLYKLIHRTMTKRYLPVQLRNRHYRLYEEDFHAIRCIQKRSPPRLPRFRLDEQDEEHNVMDEVEVFAK